MTAQQFLRLATELSLLIDNARALTRDGGISDFAVIETKVARLQTAAEHLPAGERGNLPPSILPDLAAIASGLESLEAELTHGHVARLAAAPA